MVTFKRFIVMMLSQESSCLSCFHVFSVWISVFTHSYVVAFCVNKKVSYWWHSIAFWRRRSNVLITVMTLSILRLHWNWLVFQGLIRLRWLLVLILLCLLLSLLNEVWEWNVVGCLGDGQHGVRHALKEKSRWKLKNEDKKCMINHARKTNARN